MNANWFRLTVLTLLSLGSLVALSIDAPVKAPPANKPPAAETKPAPASAPPVTKPAPDDKSADVKAAETKAAEAKADEPTEAEQKDADGGFQPAPESDKPIELPPEMRGTADFDISFPIDI